MPVTMEAIKSQVDTKDYKPDEITISKHSHRWEKLAQGAVLLGEIADSSTDQNGTMLVWGKHAPIPKAEPIATEPLTSTKPKRTGLLNRSRSNKKDNKE